MRRLSYFWHFLFYCFQLTCSTCIQGIELISMFVNSLSVLDRILDVISRNGISVARLFEFYCITTYSLSNSMPIY